MANIRHYQFIVLGMVLLLAAVSPARGAEPAAEKAAAEKTTAPKQLVVYADKDSPENSFYPSQYIGDAAAITFDEGWTEKPQSGKTCMRVIYAPQGDFGWAGLYWVNPAGNWGKQKGGYDLRFAKRLTFWARGEKGGEHIAVFRYGGIKGAFNDSDNHGIGPLVLTNEWTQYTVDLSKRNLKYISAGFSFALTKAHNREGVVFYVDNVKFEE